MVEREGHLKEGEARECGEKGEGERASRPIAGERARERVLAATAARRANGRSKEGGGWVDVLDQTQSRRTDCVRLTERDSRTSWLRATAMTGEDALTDAWSDVDMSA